MEIGKGYEREVRVMEVENERRDEYYIGVIFLRPQSKVELLNKGKLILHD